MCFLLKKGRSDCRLLGNGEVHLAQLAVAVDSEGGVARTQVESSGQLLCLFVFEAGTQLAAQAITGVHDLLACGRCVGVFHLAFEGGLDVDDTMVMVELACQVIGDIVGTGEDCGKAVCVSILVTAAVTAAAHGPGAVEQLDCLATQLCER